MILQDLLFGFRMLWRRRFSTALCLAVLGLGSTAAISVFAVVQRYLLSPLPYPQSERLVMVFNHYKDGGLTVLSPLVLRDFQERTRSMETIGAYSTQPVHLLSGGEPARITAATITANLPHILGMGIRLGRTFSAAETVPGQDRVVILSHQIWRTRFGGDPEMVGKQVNINGTERTVVGIAVAEFQLPEQADIFAPLALPGIWYTEERRGWEFLTAIGRMAPGVGPAEASKELSGIFAAVAPRRAAKGQAAEAVGLQERLLGDRPSALLTLFLSASALALMAWFNVANLLLARAESRVSEFSLRMALGSGRSGLLRLLVLESAMLGLFGGLIGLVSSFVVLWLLKTPLMDYLNVPGRLEMSVSVAFAAVGVSVLTGVVFGIIPALRASGIGLVEALKRPGRGSSSGEAGGFWRKGLVTVQVAVSLCLLIAVSLLTVSLARLGRVSPGFNPDHLVSLRLELPQSRYPVPRRGEFHRRLLEEARSLPGVSDAALAYALPLTGRVWTASFEIEGQTPDPDSPEPGGNIRPVSADYFKTMGIPLLEGRFFDTADSVDSPPVAIVDAALARQFWPGQSPLGQRLLDIVGAKAATVVGVVGAVKDVGLHVQSNGHLYFPLSQRPDIRQFDLVVRTRVGQAMAIVPALSERIRELDPLLPVFGVATLDQHVAETLRGYRQGVALVTFFGVLAVVLAAAGIYGVASYSVACRTGEMGVRLALGAQGRHLLGMVLADTLKLALPGLALGLPLAFLVGRAIRSFLYGVGAAEWRLLLPTMGLIVIVAVLAGLQPALRAARTDCMKAIRWE